MAKPTTLVYLTILITLFALLLPSLLRLNSPTTLPSSLHRHYSTGKLINLPIPPTNIFTFDLGPRSSRHTVLLLPGLACPSVSYLPILRSLAASGLRAVSLDPPGSGFSDPLPHPPSRLRQLYRDVREKGIFWGFDHLVETGHIPEIQQPNLPFTDMSVVISQVVESLGLMNLHLVLHDSALMTAANWVLANPSLVRSVTLVDAAAESAAFPARLLGVPIIGQVLLGSGSVFNGLLKLCCSRAIDAEVAEGYRHLLKGDGGRGVVEAGSGLNFSFDVGEWAELEAVRGLPVQVVWSNNWSDVWIDEGRRVAEAVPRAKVEYHSGGRWPQEDAAEVVAEMIAQFVLSLPKSVRQDSKEPLPEHIPLRVDEENIDQRHDNNQHHHNHDQGDEHAAGYMNRYGLDQGWES